MAEAAKSSEVSIDALLPPQMAEKAEQIGVKKAGMELGQLAALAFLAGAFIALGAMFSTTVAAGSAALPYGLVRLMTWLAFSLGLILVIVGGAELFTGNNLIIMAWANRRVSTAQVLRNWLVVYLGNFAGALATAVLMLFSGQYRFAQGAVGAAALNTAAGKTSLEFTQAILLGAMCNVLVCLAVWLTFSARTTSDRVLAIVPPITAFVACGFEHSIANMYFIPLGLLIKGAAPPAFWSQVDLPASALADLTWAGFFVNNLLPVTIGNLLGGAAMVGAVYWFIYLRKPVH
jgi:formate transporter